MPDNNTCDDAARLISPLDWRLLLESLCVFGRSTDGSLGRDLKAVIEHELHARDAALRDAREEIENLQADADMDGTMIRKLREQAARLREQIAAERASIVAMLRREAETGPVGAAAACRYCADLIERAARAQPEPKLPDERCGQCDNGVDKDWCFCPWCGEDFVLAEHAQPEPARRDSST